jgi:predicted enzyme related to lactoylglutathione lyase
MAENTGMHGQICWFEVPVTSVSRAAAFYTAVLGWNCDVEAKPSPAVGISSVHMFSKGALHGAFLLVADEDAVAKIADPKRPEVSGPVATFMVSNIDETLKKVEAAGGKSHMYVILSSLLPFNPYADFVNSPKTEIGGGMGVFARFTDTEGNLQGLWAKE